MRLGGGEFPSRARTDAVLPPPGATGPPPFLFGQSARALGGAEPPTARAGSLQRVDQTL